MRSVQLDGPKMIALVLAAGMVMPTAWQPRTAMAYERYNDGCHVCHGSFWDATSPQGTTFPGGSKHTMHANFMSPNCSLCHRDGDDWNPYLGWSNGSVHNPPVGCTGCHGRDYGPGVGHSGVGLRAHHAFAGVTVCASCHTQDPSPLPESVTPIYYGTADTGVDDPCNAAPDFLENWSVGDTTGLDNDGDGLYDEDDSDCHPGDIDGDGDVDFDDVTSLVDVLLGIEGDPSFLARSDLNGDGAVDGLDVAPLVGILLEP